MASCSSDSDESQDALNVPSEPVESAATFSGNKKPKSTNESKEIVDGEEENDDHQVLQLDLLLKDDLITSSKHSDDESDDKPYSILSRMIPLLDSTKLNSLLENNKIINSIDQNGGVLSMNKLKEQAPSPDDYVRGSLVLSNGKSVITNMPLMSWCVLTESLGALEYLLDEFEDEFDPILPCLDGPFQGKTCFELLNLLRLNFEEEFSEDDSFSNQAVDEKPSPSNGGVLKDNNKEQQEKTLKEQQRAERKRKLLKKLDLIMHEVQKYQQKHVEELINEMIEPNRRWLESFLKKSNIPSSKINETMIGMTQCGLITNDLTYSKEDCLNILASINDRDMDDLGEFIPDLTTRNQLVETAKQLLFVGKDNKMLKQPGKKQPTQARFKEVNEQELPLWKLAIFQVLLLVFFAWIFVVLSKNKEYQEIFRLYGMIE